MHPGIGFFNYLWMIVNALTMKFYSLLIVSFLLSTVLFAQNDSLLKVLDTAKLERKVKTLNELFRANLQQDPVKAIGYTREALNYATEIGDERGTAASYNNLGIAYKNQGAWDRALEYYIRALGIYEKLKNVEGVAVSKNNISNIYAAKADYGQAMKYLQESHASFIQLGDQTKIIGSMNNLGNLHNDLQLYEQALKYFSEASQLAEKAGIPYGDPLTNIGNVYFRQNNYQRAIDSYMRALQIEKENNNRLGMLSVITNIGIAYTKAGQPKPASEYLREAERLAKELQAKSSIPVIYKYMAENLYKQRKTDDAYKIMVRYDSAREKIYSEESNRKIAQMEMVLDFQQKEEELQILEKEDQIKSLQLRNSRLFVIMVILGILIAIGGINIYFLNNRKRFIG